MNQDFTPKRDRSVRDWVRWGMSLRRGERVDSLSSPQKIGALSLAKFQRRAADRLVEVSMRYGGALLADAPGLGKTRVGLVAAARIRRLVDPRAKILCVAPMRQIDTWRRTFARAGLKEHDDVCFCSHTSLSRGNLRDLQPVVLVVDEAHRFRNPSTKRSEALAKLATKAHTLLITATPVCKSLDDLERLLRIFLLEDAPRELVGCDLSDAFRAHEAGAHDALDRILEEVAVRREFAPDGEDFGRRPGTRLEVLEYEASDAEEWLWQNLERHAREMELVLLEASWPRGLLAEHLLRRWESGPRALSSTLESLVRFHERWLEAADHGANLSRELFGDLFTNSAGGVDQGVLPFLFHDEEDAPTTSLIEAVQQNLAVLQELLDASRACHTCYGRDAAICELLAREPDQKYLIFTGYVDAATGLFDTLRKSLGASAQIGLVTGKGARATGIGSCAASDLIARFAPIAQEHHACASHHAIQILIATDCLAEGVDLQDCGRIILADLPYTPLAVEQRVGRLLRPGSPHEEVIAYLPRPTSWPDSLGMRRRLDVRLGAARSVHTRYLAASALTRDGEDAPRADVLAAHETLDRWSCRVLDEGGDVCELGGDWSARSRFGAGLFALVQRGSPFRPRHTWWRVAPDGRVETGCAIWLPHLIALHDEDVAIYPASENGVREEIARKHARHRTETLRAAFLAPRRLPEGSPQVELWRRYPMLEQDAHHNAWRVRLLRPQPRGVTLALGRLLEANTPPQELARRLDALLPPRAPEDAPPRVEILGTLLVS